MAGLGSSGYLSGGTYATTQRGWRDLTGFALHGGVYMVRLLRDGHLVALGGSCIGMAMRWGMESGMGQNGMARKIILFIIIHHHQFISREMAFTVIALVWSEPWILPSFC